jgi:hypothetical protein
MLAHRSSLYGALALALGLGACRSPREQVDVSLPSASASSGAVTAPLWSRAVATEAGFELVALPDGAALAVAEKGGGLTVLLLDKRGAQRSPPVTVPEAGRERIGEVALASAGTRLALAWVSLSGGEGAVFGALGDASTRSFAPPMSLGSVTLEHGAVRGYLSVAAGSQGEFLVLKRGADEPCVEDATRRCAAYGFRELGPATTETRGLPMSVPASCAHGLAGFVSVEERWHYGLCSQAEGRPVTTHFMRQLKPFYVEVHRSFEGCAPLGSTVLGKDAFFVADCPGGRRGVRVGAMRQALREIDLSQVDVACESGRPVFRDPERSLELRLEGPRDGLGVLLPRRLGKGNARAAWTGSRLLIASVKGGDVSLQSYGCRGSVLLGP